MDIVRVPILAPAAPAVFPVEVPVVALVASAGGLDALTRVLAPLSAELPAAVLVARHQDPTRVSQLVGFLEDRTALPVRAVRDGDRVEVGQMLVIPPAAHLIVTATGVLGLIDTGAIPPARPSVVCQARLSQPPRHRLCAMVGSGARRIMVSMPLPDRLCFRSPRCRRSRTWTSGRVSGGVDSPRTSR